MENPIEHERRRIATRTRGWIGCFVVLWIVTCAGGLAVAARHLWLSVHVELACEQVGIFDDMCKMAHEGNAIEAAEALQYTMNYYPSGTKQVSGSALDRVVESARRHAIDEILRLLRDKTGEDYGDDPEEWLKHLLPSRESAIPETHEQ